MGGAETREGGGIGDKAEKPLCVFNEIHSKGIGQSQVRQARAGTIRKGKKIMKRVKGAVQIGCRGGNGGGPCFASRKGVRSFRVVLKIGAKARRQWWSG